MQVDPGGRLQWTQDTFVVEKVQGEGGFGITYRCHRERDGLPVIAKVLRMERRTAPPAASRPPPSTTAPTAASRPSRAGATSGSSPLAPSST